MSSRPLGMRALAMAGVWRQAVLTTTTFGSLVREFSPIRLHRYRSSHDVVTAVVRFVSTVRTIVDGRKFGFRKLIANRKTCRILGCHVVLT